MEKAVCDAKGRIYLKRRTRKQYGERFVVVQAPDRLILLPVPKDPVADLARLGKPLRGLSLKAIKQAIQKQAEREVST